MTTSSPHCTLPFRTSGTKTRGAGVLRRACSSSTASGSSGRSSPPATAARAGAALPCGSRPPCSATEPSSPAVSITRATWRSEIFSHRNGRRFYPRLRRARSAAALRPDGARIRFAAPAALHRASTEHVDIKQPHSGALFAGIGAFYFEMQDFLQPYSFFFSKRARFPAFCGHAAFLQKIFMFRLQSVHQRRGGFLYDNAIRWSWFTESSANRRRRHLVATTTIHILSSSLFNKNQADAFGRPLDFYVFRLKFFDKLKAARSFFAASDRAFRCVRRR